MKKAASLLLTIIIATMCLSACGVSNDQFKTKVRESKIVGGSSPLFDGIETILDFEEKVKSYNDNYIRVSTSWNDEKVKKDGSLIKAFEKETAFIYDNKKTYGYMWVHIIPDIYGSSPEISYWYLFSLDKSGHVKTEAAARATEMMHFEELYSAESNIKDTMAANILYLEMLKGLHTEK